MQALSTKAPGWAKGLGRRSIMGFRQATWRHRLLPEFIIIGAQKAGTSSLYTYLSQHPALIASYRKEVHFFDGGLDPAVDSFSRGEAWYRAHFPGKRGAGGDKKAFEASPSYIYHPLAPGRIADLIPDVKLIALLRDPIERAISHYFHEARGGRESLPVMEALESEEKRLAPTLATHDYKDVAFTRHSYKARGLYHEQISRYLTRFPKSNLLVMNSDTLFASPGSALKQVFEFVGVDAGFQVEDLRPRNVGGDRTQVEPGVHEYLQDYFRAPNRLLFDLIGEDYGWST